MTGVLTIKSKQREMLLLREIRGQTEFSLFENFIRKHRNTSEDSTIYIQFQSNNSESSWSGPICVASLGCFFLKFRKKQSNELLVSSTIATDYANVHVAEEGPSLVMRFYKPPVVKLPYRIENCLHDALITYYQKVVLLLILSVIKIKKLSRLKMTRLQRFSLVTLKKISGLFRARSSSASA